MLALAVHGVHILDSRYPEASVLRVVVKLDRSIFVLICAGTVPGRGGAGGGSAVVTGCCYRLPESRFIGPLWVVMVVIVVMLVAVVIVVVLLVGVVPVRFSSSHLSSLRQEEYWICWV